MAQNSPPPARLAFRVGVVGHRPNRLQNADLTRLGELIHEILHAVQTVVGNFQATSPDAKLYSGEKPILRAVTPLAEGTDRIFAEQALELGYELCCPMPFHQAEYELDFMAPNSPDPNSLDRFRGLLKKAKDTGGLTTFQLDGERTNNAGAYGAAGRVVLDQSDLLVVVWDGDKPAGGGGTVETLKEAIDYGVPVLWIEAVKPHQWCMLLAKEELKCLGGPYPCVPVQSQFTIAEAVKDLVQRELALPLPEPTAPGEKPDRPVTAWDYFAESKPLLHLAVLWKLFRDLVGSLVLKWPTFIVQDYEEELKDQWPTDKGTSTAQWVNQRLLPHYAWSDKLADRYADAYRSTYIFIYLSAAFAVFLALLPVAAGWAEGSNDGLFLCVLGEFVLLLSITGLLLWENRRRWHLRWMAYRLLAELIRQLKCLLPLGGGPPLARVPEHLAAFGNPVQSWMYWHLRAIERAIGIPNATVTPEYLGECLDYLDKLAGSDSGGQTQFHRTTHERNKRLNHRLHVAALSAFALTLACIAAHLLPLVVLRLGTELSQSARVEGWLTLACATLPAFGAAMGGISNQGEFARIAKRSRAMANALESLAKEIDTLRTQKASGRGAPRLAQVAALADRVTQLMVDEVVEWRVIFIDRPPTAA